MILVGLSEPLVSIILFFIVPVPDPKYIEDEGISIRDYFSGVFITKFETGWFWVLGGLVAADDSLPMDYLFDKGISLKEA